MPDIFDQLNTSKIGNSGKDIFDDISTPEQSWSEWVSRTAGSIATGAASATTYGIATNLSNFLALGDVNDPEELERIKEISEREGIPFDEEKYKESAKKALLSFPTPSNIARMTEESTGMPITAKDKLQKAIELGSSAAKFQPGTVAQKSSAGILAPASSHILQEVGIPEPIADIIGLGIGNKAGNKTPEIDIGKSKKQSGLTERQFEKLSTDRVVSEKKLNQINKKIESDFKSISEKIIKESPIGETFENLKNDPTFKQQSRELLNQAQEIANSTPGSISSRAIKKEIADLSSKNFKGFSKSEYDKNYNKFINESIENISSDKITPAELVQQYRENNSSLGEYFEPGASKALNRAKRDAILDNNRAIANVIEKIDPELSKVFKEGNSRWTKIMDAEAVDSFVNEIFSDKINYKTMHDFFDKSGYDRIFKRSLGDKGFKEFDLLMKDMIGSESAYKMLKIAKEKGYDDLFKTGLGYIIHPKLGAAKAALDVGKYVFKTTMNSLLDKPKLVFTWKSGVDNLKKGNFSKAEKNFNDIKNEAVYPDEIISENKKIELKPSKKEESRRSALKKFNNKKSDQS